ncbi:MAG: lipoyl synthase, partial [Planctomycetota bacterium]
MRPKTSVPKALSDRRKPPWLKVRAPGGENYVFLKGVMQSRGLHTVCEEARCPNIGECWAAGTATFMLLGDVCTRACRFCAVKTGNPRQVVDEGEPRRVAEAVQAMRLRYVVLTSVDRDDLADQGSGVFARTVAAIKAAAPAVLVESLIPDFRGDRECLRVIAAAGGEVVAHNVETTRSLTRKVRDRRCDFDQSLRVLRALKDMRPELITKSSIMLGLGESAEEVDEALQDLRAAQVDIVTLGQYLQPTPL